MGAAIRLLELSKDYGEVLALDAVDLTVEQGELLGFLGPNGAGKTTAIRVLLDLIRPTGGAAEVMGFDTQRYPLEVHRRVGYLSGDLRLYEKLTSHELFTLAARMRGLDLDRSRRDSMIERLQLDPTRRIRNLSRGNKQKVGIILALVFRPDVLLLDEPSSGLDPFMQEELASMLREAAADGATIFFSSHVLSEVEALCDRAAMLRAGRLVAVEDLRERRRLAPHRLQVEFTDAPAEAFLHALPAGIHVREHNGARVTFEVDGIVDPLIKRLATVSVQQIVSEEIGLDELFHAYYERADAVPEGEADQVA